MNSNPKTKRQLIEENDELRDRLSEAQDTLEAIRSGSVDALVISDTIGEKIYSLESVDYSYRVMVENMNEGAVVLNEQGIVIFGNKAFSSMVSRDLSSLPGTPFSDVIATDLFADFSSFMIGCADAPGRREFALTCKRGNRLPVSIACSRFSVSGTSNFCLIITDLVEQKRAERKLRTAYEEIEKKVKERTSDLQRAMELSHQHAQALRESEHRLRTALDGGRMGMFEWDLKTNLCILDETNLALMGLPKEAGAVDVNELLYRVHPDDRAAFGVGLKEILARQENLEYEFRILPGDDKRERWQRIAGRIIHDDSGKPLRITGVNYDITERKNLEQALFMRVRELDAANEELKAFSHSLSHDLRSPLHTIKGFTDIINRKHGESIPPDAQELFAYVIDGVNRMNDLIEDMLKLSRISRQEITKENIDLCEIARDVVSDLQHSDPERSVNLVIGDSAIATGDPQLLRIALTNLLGNAWKYTSKKSDARIEFGAQVYNNEAVYHVRDNGAGFDMKSRDRLFEPFHRLHSGAEFPGTGIGLAIVKKVIDRHHGRIWAESEIGNGASFYFSLPRRR